MHTGIEITDSGMSLPCWGVLRADCLVHSALAGDNLCKVLNMKGRGKEDEEDATWFVGSGVWLGVYKYDEL